MTISPMGAVLLAAVICFVLVDVAPLSSAMDRRNRAASLRDRPMAFAPRFDICWASSIARACARGLWCLAGCC